MYFEILVNQKGQDKLTATEHQHDNTVEIIQIVNGSGNLLIGKHIYEFKKGDVFVFDASALHCTTPSKPDEYVRSKLIAEKQALLPLSDKLLRNVYFRADSETEKKLCELFSAACEAGSEQDSELLAISAMLKIFHLCYQNKNSIMPIRSGIAFEIMDFVNCNPAEADSLDRVAAGVHLSKFHMCRKFKEETGVTVHSYIKSRKLALAKKLLAERDLSIAYIACETGFGDTASFTKAFKKEAGLTPSAYRLALTKGN